MSSYVKLPTKPLDRHRRQIAQRVVRVCRRVLIGRKCGCPTLWQAVQAIVCSHRNAIRVVLDLIEATFPTVFIRCRSGVPRGVAFVFSRSRLSYAYWVATRIRHALALAGRGCR